MRDVRTSYVQSVGYLKNIESPCSTTKKKELDPQNIIEARNSIHLEEVGGVRNSKKIRHNGQKPFALHRLIPFPYYFNTP